MGCGASAPAEAVVPPQPEVPAEKPAESTDASQIAELEDAITKVNSDDTALQLEGTVAVRKLISNTSGPCLPLAVERNVAPRFVLFLKTGDTNLQYEAAWALTNIASGDTVQTQNVVDAGAVPVLTQLLRSPAANVAEQVLWALGNVSGEPAFCGVVLEQGAIVPIVELMQKGPPPLSLTKTGTWTLSNLFHGKPAPELEVLQPALPLLATLLSHENEDVQTDACAAFAHLSAGVNARIQAVLDAGILPRVVELLSGHTTPMAVQALKVVGNIVSGNEAQTQAALDLGVLPHLKFLLQPDQPTNLQKESAWALSNITAGTQAQVQQVMDAGLIEPLMERLQNAPVEVQRECNWAISNATCGSTEQVQQLLNIGGPGALVKLLCQVLATHDDVMVPVALDALKNILKVGAEVAGDGPNAEAARVQENGGVAELQRLATADPPNATAVQLLADFFPDSSPVAAA